MQLLMVMYGRKSVRVRVCIKCSSALSRFVLCCLSAGDGALSPPMCTWSPECHVQQLLVHPSDTANRLFNGKDISGTIRCVYKTMSNSILDYLAHANPMYNPSKCCPKQTTNPPPHCNKKGNAREKLALAPRCNKVAARAQQPGSP